MNNRYFYMKDVDCTITVEYATRKEMLELIDNFVENVKTRDEMIEAGNPNACYYDMSQETFSILYKDGSFEYIDESFDGHHIKRQNIASIINENSSTIMVYGHFEMNECGVAGPAFEDEINDTNIKEVDREDYTEETTEEAEEVTEETVEETSIEEATIQEDEMCYRLYVNGEVVETQFSLTALYARLAEWFAVGYTADQCEIKKEKYYKESTEETTAEEVVEEETTTKVKAYHGYCIGATVTGLHYYGEIVKTNKKSIKVNFNRFVKTEGKKTILDREYNGGGTFTFWKTYNKDGKTIDIYKNKAIGIIEIENKEYHVKGGE